MRNMGISVFWPKEGRKRDPLVGVKLNGYRSTGELKKVIVVIVSSLQSSFPGVPVTLLNSATEELRKAGEKRGLRAAAF
ncbi:unnamed protein product [marine sediment metagenome]|uniref:Uncharacterized protein n=1 Tax=marine sediment metagenome TaxID=412755 RepID=X1Q9E9_9ZZZZ